MGFWEWMGFENPRGHVSDIKNLVGDELVASAIKSAMAELAPNEVTNRTKIEPLAQQKLAESLVQKYGEDVVFVNKVVINDMNFEDAYNEAIQQKSIAQQNADKQKIENEAAIANGLCIRYHREKRKEKTAHTLMIRKRKAQERALLEQEA